MLPPELHETYPIAVPFHTWQGQYRVRMPVQKGRHARGR